ncbi:MAG: hypothetical protein ACFFBP_04195 [Promethearchaeota archaeon]
MSREYDTIWKIRFINKLSGKDSFLFASDISLDVSRTTLVAVMKIPTEKGIIDQEFHIPMKI